MKKNKMMRLASSLLVAVLLTTSVISGTFAKYTTKGEATGSARVAGFGVVVTAAADPAFKSSYATHDTTVKTTIETSVANQTTDGKNLVAPGTNGTLGTLNITGKPEVAVTVEAKVNLELENWTVDGNVYCPIEIKVGEEWYKVDAQTTTTEALETKVEELIVKAIVGTSASVEVKDGVSSAKVNYAPGYDFTTDFDQVTVEWKWAYEGNDDTKDTKLGNASTPAEIVFTYEVSVTQID